MHPAQDAQAQPPTQEKTLTQRHRPAAIVALLTLTVLAGAACGSTRHRADLATASSNATSTSSTIPAKTTTTIDGVRRTIDPTESPRALAEPFYPEELSSWGREASLAEKHEAAVLLRRYFKAVATLDGHTACALLHPEMAKATVDEITFPRSPAYLRSATDCPTAVEAYFRHLYTALRVHPGKNFTAVTVTHVRTKDAQGFIQFHSAVAHDGAISIKRDGASWRIDALLGQH
jgi:hypothetical protein